MWVLIRMDTLFRETPELTKQSVSHASVGHLFVKSPKICGKQERPTAEIFIVSQRTRMPGVFPIPFYVFED